MWSAATWRRFETRDLARKVQPRLDSNWRARSRQQERRQVAARQTILMHVTLISPCNQVIMPYLRHYEEILTRHQITYDLIYWDRLALQELDQPHYHCLHHHAPGGSGWVSGVRGYLHFRRFAIRHLQEITRRHPETTVICLNTQCVVMLTRQLQDRPYLLDIRDYTHERFTPYRRLACRMIRNARLTFISSEGFRTWLPDGPEYVLAHNVGTDDFQQSPTPWPAHGCRISCIGVIRNAPENIAFLDALFTASSGSVRDAFPEVHFFGGGLPAGEGAIHDHCRRRRYARVHFHGRYRPEEAARFYEGSHFVLGVYGNRTPFERTLTPNRLYQAAIHRRPIIVSADTHLAEVVRKYGLGIVFTGDGAALGRDLAAYADESIRAAFQVNCVRFLAQVRADITNFETRLLNALRF